MGLTKALAGALALVASCQALILPKPTGPYNVGVRRYMIDFKMAHPQHEHKWLLDVTDGYMLTVYYPTLDESTPSTSLEPAFADYIEQKLKLYPGSLHNIKGHRNWNASYLPVKEPVGPTIFFDARLRFPPTDGNSILLSDLASHGYTVGAIDHPYEQLYLKLPNGEEVGHPLGLDASSHDYDLYLGYNAATLRRCNVTNHLMATWPSLVEEWGAPFKTSNFGLLGIDMGASAMLDVSNNTNVGALAMIDLKQPRGHYNLKEGFSWMQNNELNQYAWGDGKKSLAHWGLDLKTPALHLAPEHEHTYGQWMHIYFLTNFYRQMVVKDAEVMDFTDWTMWKHTGAKRHQSIDHWYVRDPSLLNHHFNIVGNIKGTRMVEITTTIIRAFFERFLKAGTPWNPIFEEKVYEEVVMVQGSYDKSPIVDKGPYHDRGFAYPDKEADKLDDISE